MRSIKFRAWDKESNEMFFPQSSGVEEFYFDFMNGELKLLAHMEEDYPEVRDAVIMQFTGLLDKKGKEIYEGDILQPIDSTVSRAVVGFRDGEYIREWQKVDGGPEFGRPLHLGLELFEVIGNIYENPELLTHA